MTEPTTRDVHRILVADDDPGMRALVAEALRKDGYEVHEVSSGAGLLERLSAFLLDGACIEIDLVISDIRMPLLSGLEMLAGLRDVECAVDFILMTAFGDEHVHREAERLGAIALLNKPFELKKLRTLVREHFDSPPGLDSPSNSQNSGAQR